MRAIFFSFVLVFSAQAFARDTSHFIPNLNALPLTIDADNVKIKGFRFLNKNGEPNHGKFVLFTHGLHSNLHEFEHMVRAKMAEGYDCYAFNFRGHGNSNEKSTVIDYHEGDYSFERMADTDFPAMLNLVRRMNGQKGFIIGHSMGGMVPRASIAKGLVDQSQIEGMVLLGSPPHFRNQFNLLPPSLLDRFLTGLYAGSGRDPFSIAAALHKYEADLDFMNMANPVYWLMKMGLTKQWSILKDVIEALGFYDGHWATRAMTNQIPKDIMRSFATYQTEYPYEDVKLAMPVLYIMGEKDILVKMEDIMETAKAQSKNSGYWFITLKGVGHLSLIAPAAFESYRESLRLFMDAPASIGPANLTHIENNLGFCSRLLLGA